MRRLPLTRTGLSPRSRGNHSLDDALEKRNPVPGLSPRSRGNQQAAVDARHGDVGSIPALAGEPNAARTDFSDREALGLSPRSRGNRRRIRGYRNWCPALGLSPRSRGNLARHCELTVMEALGSIPALAGNPRYCDHQRRREGSDPRARGGTFGIRISCSRDRGLSPRSRGNLSSRAFNATALILGSIPALAGEPSWIAASRAAASMGLSPRSRGNRESVSAASREHGSIPALAGNLAYESKSQAIGRVYPRARGGTSSNQLVEFSNL